MSRHRAGGTTRLPRRLRFLAKLLLVVVVLTWAPTVAQAAFSTTEAAVVSVGTYDVPAPTGVDASPKCATSSPRSATVTIRNFTAVQRATGYTVTLTGPSGRVQSAALDAKTRTTTISVSSSTNGKYLLSLQARVGAWTGDTVTYTFTC